MKEATSLQLQIFRNQPTPQEDEETKVQMAQAKIAFMDLVKVLSKRELSVGLSRKVLNCRIAPNITYESETWAINSTEEMNIEADERWFLRKRLKILYTKRTTNKTVLKNAKATRLLYNIRRQSYFFQHVMPRKKLKYLAISEKISEKK